ncbi:MAG: 50S ribosomal protein L10 [Gammaproteobacteria bacterium]|nr:50S ribosomal protein L10 [Gammaproteobacteria bacterium]
MALNLEQKKAIVSELGDVAKNALSVIAADYRGLTVSEMTELRTKARESKVYLRVIRNTLAKRALADTSFACIEESLFGPIALFFALDAPGAAARIIQDFIKEHEKLEVRALVVGDRLIPVQDLAAVAKLPTYEEAIALFMSVMKAPITKFVRTLAEPHAKMVRTLAAFRDQKQ